MSTIDHIMDSDDPRIQMLIQEVGHLDAQCYLRTHNAACVLLDGFEQLIKQRINHSACTLAPLTNVSELIN